jgi:secretion/DNA translocation related TadE-like protein
VSRQRFGVSGDQGSATILWLSALMVCLVFAVVGFALTEFASARARVAAAADLSALAAAGRPWLSDGCQQAAEIAKANDARLRSCRIDGTEVDVEVDGRARGILASVAGAAGKSPPLIVVSARAGQRESEP